MGVYKVGISLYVSSILIKRQTKKKNKNRLNFDSVHGEHKIGLICMKYVPDIF